MRRSTPLQPDEVVQGNITIISAQGWYAINGTGEYLTASTCTGDASIDNYELETVLAVYNGTCANLIQVGSNDYDASCSGYKSQSDWLSEANEVYYIVVSGYVGATGSFGLTVSSNFTSPGTLFPSDYSSRELCNYANPLLVGATVQGSIAGLIGPWYSVVGTGEYLDLPALATAPLTTLRWILLSLCTRAVIL